MTKSVLLGVTCLSFGLLACPGAEEEDSAGTIAISGTTAALTASDNCEHSLQGLLDAGGFLADSASISDAMGTVLSSESETCDCPVAGCDSGEVVCVSESTGYDMEESRQEMRDGVADFVKQLREEILIEKNLVSSTDTSATYRVGPSVLCDDDSAASDPIQSGSTSLEPQYDPACVADVERLNLQLRLTSPREGDVDVTVLVGKDASAPLTIELYKNSFGLQVDLAEALEAARNLGDDYADVQEMSGKLALRLTQNKAQDYNLELDVVSAVSLKLVDGGEPFSVQIAPSSPAFNVHLDGNARTLSSTFALGALSMTGPLSLLAQDDDTDEFGVEPVERTYTGVLEMFLAGLSGTLDYAADGDVINLRNLGLGGSTSTLSHQGNQLLGIDLNAAGGRHVDVKLEAAGEGVTRISVTPSFDLRMALGFRHVADQIDDIADYMLDNTVHVLFNGTAPTLDVGEDDVRVVSGNLSLESTSDPAGNISAAAGMCLVEATTEVESTGAFGDLEAATCQ